MTARRCAPSPCAILAPIPDSASSPRRCSSSSIFCRPAVACRHAPAAAGLFASMGACRPQMNYHFSERKRVRSCRESSNSGLLRLIPPATAAQLRLAPRSQAPLCAARRAPTASPRPHASGIVVAAIGTIADLSTTRRGRFRKVSSARACAWVCMRAATCAAIGAAGISRCCCVAAWPSRPGRPRLTRVVCRAVAGPSAVAALPPRANPAGRGGRGAAHNGRTRRRTRARAVGAARPDCGSVGGVRG